MEWTMDHAEARGQLADLALEPGRLRQLDRDSEAIAPELREHVERCAECREELAAWRRTLGSVEIAAAAGAPSGPLPARPFRSLVDSIDDATPSAELRARTLGALRSGQAPAGLAIASAPRAERPSTLVADQTAPRGLGRGSGPGGRRTSIRTIRLPAWLAVAAVLVVLVGGGAIVADRTGQLDQVRSQSAELGVVTATLDRILMDPAHHVLTLRAPQSGTPAGSLAWSAADNTVVILSSALVPPPAGQVYKCWIKQGGGGIVVGEMRFSGTTAYWAGTLDTWGQPVAPGNRFWVSLEPIVGGGTGTPVLEGTF